MIFRGRKIFSTPIEEKNKAVIWLIKRPIRAETDSPKRVAIREARGEWPAAQWRRRAQERRTSFGRICTIFRS
jgi:hypothetical protein